MEDQTPNLDSFPIETSSGTPPPEHHNDPLGTLPNDKSLPPEIINSIYQVVLADDEDMIITPSSLRLAGASEHDQGACLASHCALLRTCMVSRRIYYSMLIHKARKLEHRNLRVLSKLHEQAKGQFSIRLMWTEEWLRAPRGEELQEWLIFTNDYEPGPYRLYPWSEYFVDPMSAKYVYPVQVMISQLASVNDTVQGPEVRLIMRAFWNMIISEALYVDDRGVPVRGKWVAGKWVVDCEGGSENNQESEREMTTTTGNVVDAAATDGSGSQTNPSAKKKRKQQQAPVKGVSSRYALRRKT